MTAVSFTPAVFTPSPSGTTSIGLQSSSAADELPAVTVVICAYTESRWDDTLAAVTSCFAQTHRPDAVIVVVDHNPTLLGRLQAALPECWVMANALSRGLSGGRNTGLNEAATPLVAFLDDDAIAEPAWLETLSRHCVRRGVLGAGGSSAPNWGGGSRPRWLPQEFMWVAGCSYRGQPLAATPVRNLMGGCMCVWRTVFEAVGGFHEDLGRGASGLPISCEDSEFCMRANAAFADETFVYEPEAVIRHRVWAERMTWPYFLRRCYAEGLSKAFIARLGGNGLRRLSDERSYALKVLPAGALRGVTDAFRGDPSGVGRAAAIVLGLAATVLGFVRGRLMSEARPSTAQSNSGR